MAGKFSLTKSSGGNGFHFTLIAGNGEPVLTSETYTSKASAEAGIESVKVNAPNINRYERQTASTTQPYFVLKAANGQPIGSSETYSSVAAMERGIAVAVQHTSPTAVIEDLT